jgi:hypothetical protein
VRGQSSRTGSTADFTFSLPLIGGKEARNVECKETEKEGRERGDGVREGGRGGFTRDN